MTPHPDRDLRSAGALAGFADRTSLLARRLRHAVDRRRRDVGSIRDVDWMMSPVDAPSVVTIDWRAISRAIEVDCIARRAGGNGWLRQTWTLPEVAPPADWLGIDAWAGKR